MGRQGTNVLGLLRLEEEEVMPRPYFENVRNYEAFFRFVEVGFALMSANEAQLRKANSKLRNLFYKKDGRTPVDLEDDGTLAYMLWALASNEGMLGPTERDYAAPDESMLLGVQAYVEMLEARQDAPTRTRRAPANILEGVEHPDQLEELGWTLVGRKENDGPRATLIESIKSRFRNPSPTDKALLEGLSARPLDKVKEVED